MAECRSCAAPIVWAVTDAGGKAMPVDAAPVDGGNVELERRDGVLYAIVHPVGQQGMFGGDRHVSHFATCPSASEWRKVNGVPEPMRFDGGTIAEDPDAPVRLSGQMLRTFDAMSDGEWHTLEWLADRAGGTEAAVSARLRDLRKPRFGSHTVERRHVGDGLWLYRLVVNHARQMAG